MYESIGKRLAIGWTMGTLVSALGVYLSLMSTFRPAPRLSALRAGAHRDGPREALIIQRTHAMS
jgi:hypothetical protein